MSEAKAFTDEDLKLLEEYCHDHMKDRQESGIVEISDIQALIARLSAAEQVIVDIVHPDKGFLDGPSWRKRHYEAWLKTCGRAK